MFKLKLLGRTHIPHYKNTAGMPPVKMPCPKEVLIPMVQHIGAPATSVVKVGDEVKVGQIIAEASGYVSAPIHSSVSGKVVKIENYLLPDGKKTPAVRIECDGLMTVTDDIVPPVVNDLDSFVDAIKSCGLVGLGGAGFPTSVKFDAAKKGIIDTIVINAAECEPYITSDTRTILDKPELVCEGVALLEKYVPTANKIVFGIEKNKPECVKQMKKAFENDAKVSVVSLPELYPQGAEKVIIHNTTGRIVPEGKLPADVGVIVINVTSLAILANYIKTGMPLVEKCITVDGSAVKEPKNVIVPIGASIIDVLDFVGVDVDGVAKVLFGGPMMGIAACSLTEPVGKRNNALTVMSAKEASLRDATECIHCGRCVSACPICLNPTAFSDALKLGIEDQVAKLEQESINLCMECGCCSYVCPAKRPLVQNNRIAKAVVREHKARQSTLK